MRKIQLTGAETFWYVMSNIAFGAGYLARIPAKKAMVDFGLVAEMTGAEAFWYVMMNVCFGAGYFAKVPVAKMISQMPQFVAARTNAVTPVDFRDRGGR
jgi:hypothetical protein